MEKRFILALVLTLLILFAWTKYFAPKPDVAPRTEEAPSATRPAETAPSAPPSARPRRLSEPATEIAGVRLESGSLLLEFSPRGAALVSGRLLGFAAHSEGKDGERLEFVHSYEGGPSALSLVDDRFGGDWLESEVWNTEGPSADGKQVTFTIEAEEDGVAFRLSKTFRVGDEPNRLALEVRLEAPGATTDFVKLLWIRTSGGVHPIDAPSGMPARSLVGIVTGDEVEIVSHVAKDVLEVSDRTIVRPSRDAILGCDMGGYFGAYLRLLDRAQGIGARFRAIPGPQEPADLPLVGPERTWTELGFRLEAAPGAAVHAAFDYYLGPKDHRVLEASYPEGERWMYSAVADHELTAQGFCCPVGPLNWLVHIISKVVLEALSFFNGVVGNMGVAIILLTLCVRLVLFPVNRRSQAAMQRHQMRMAKVKPKIEKLKEKYADDQQKFAQEQLKLFREEKLSFVPLGGCLPMFLQIPIFFGLFSAIRFDVHLRHAPFLWVDDLSVPDNVIKWDAFSIPCCFGNDIVIDGLHILPILMTLAWFIDAKMTPKSPDPQMQQQQKMMLFMPFLFGFTLYSYAAGLSLYWLTSSLVGIFEKRVIKKFFPVEIDSQTAPAKTS